MDIFVKILNYEFQFYNYYYFSVKRLKNYIKYNNYSPGGINVLSILVGTVTELFGILLSS